MADDNCLDASEAKGPIKLIRCHGMGGNQAWEFSDENKTIIHVNTGLCLTKAIAAKDATLPLLKGCDGRRSQKWMLQSNFKWQASNYDHKDDEDVES